VADVCYVADCVAKVSQLSFDVVGICSVMKVFEHHSERAVFLQLIGMKVDVFLFKMLDNGSEGIRSSA